MIIYKLANFKHINNQDFNIEDFIDKVLVVDLKDVSKSSSESIKNVLRKLNYNISLSLVPSKKIIKNEQFLHILEKTLRNIDTLFVDEAYLNEKLVDILEISKTKYITLSPKTKSKDYELLLYKYSISGITGINFDIDTVSKGHIALCSKFGLQSCVHSISFERQMEKANSLNVDALFL